jgi:hypothetical protein
VEDNARDGELSLGIPGIKGRRNQGMCCFLDRHSHCGFLSWMVTIFFYHWISGSAPSLHSDVGTQIVPYLWASESLTAIG